MASRSTSQILENLANLAIVIVAVLAAVLFFRGVFYQKPPVGAENRNKLEIGQKLDLPSIAASTGKKSLVYFLSLRCRFCSESLSFYKRIHEANGNSRQISMIAVLPERKEEAIAYFEANGIKFDEVLPKRPTDFGVNGTPTLVFLDANQTVMAIWIGKLPPEAEEGALRAIFE
jgi:thioredoxin-related protein